MLCKLFLRQNIKRVRRQGEMCGRILVGVNDTLMSAAKILAVPAPAAVKSNMPFAAERKLHSVMAVIGAAEISDHNHIVAHTAVIPAVVANDKPVGVNVEERS